MFSHILNDKQFYLFHRQEFIKCYHCGQSRPWSNGNEAVRHTPRGTGCCLCYIKKNGSCGLTPQQWCWWRNLLPQPTGFCVFWVHVHHKYILQLWQCPSWPSYFNFFETILSWLVIHLMVPIGYHTFLYGHKNTTEGVGEKEQ